jgi:hypothetical protein
MTSKFEQLIEFVINDEEAKARELFHDIVVEKSREIYESLMEEEDAEDTQEVDEGMENDGDAADDLITDVETEEEGMNEEDEMDAEFDDGAEEAGDDLTKDIEGGEGEGDIEDRVVDLEDKLDELMAEFEAMMGGDDMGAGEEEQEFDMDAGGDAIEMDDTSEIMPEMGMMENVSLSKVAPAKMGDDGANTKSVVPQNSGAKGMQGSPVKMTGDTAQGRPAPSVKEQPGYQGNGHYGKPGAAPKPVTTQAAGVNTKSPV